MDWSLPGSLVHGILQARTLEWVAISFSKGSSWPGDWTLVSCIPGRFFIIWTTRAKSQLLLRYFLTLRYYDSDKFVDISIIIQRLKAGGEGENRGWHGWMASLTRWTWVWASSGSWWWTGKPGVLQSMESQRVGHDWAAELNWTIIQRSVVTWRLGVDKLFFFFVKSQLVSILDFLGCLWDLDCILFFFIKKNDFSPFENGKNVFKSIGLKSLPTSASGYKHQRNCCT